MRLIAALLLAGSLQAGTLDLLKRAPKGKYFVYVASRSAGISIFRFDPENPGFESLGVGAQGAKPAWLAVHPGNQLLYAVSDSSLSSFAVNAKTGALRPMNSASSRGTGGCHIAIDKTGWMLLATNCASGNVASFRTEGDGGVGPSMGLQETGHARQVAITPDNFFIFVPDALDKIFSYRFMPPDATFWPNDPASLAMKAGGEPRHLAFRPDEKFAYAVNEKAATVAVLRYNREGGKLTEVVDTAPAPPGPSEIAVDAAGRFVYVSGRGDDSLAVFAIDGKRGTLKQVQRLAAGGKGPGTFRIDPGGQFLFVANEGSNAVAVFEIERKTGMLTPTGKSVSVPSPACLVFVPARGD